jgi:hypothetical protein
MTFGYLHHTLQSIRKYISDTKLRLRQNKGKKDYTTNQTVRFNQLNREPVLSTLQQFERFDRGTILIPHLNHDLEVSPVLCLIRFSKHFVQDHMHNATMHIY